MPKYRVHLVRNDWFTTTVEADSEEAALEQAYEQAPSLCAYCSGSSYGSGERWGVDTDEWTAPEDFFGAEFSEDRYGKTVEEVLKVYDQYVEKGITEAELETAKAQLIGQFPRSLETADGMAFQLLLVDFYRLPMTYLTDFPRLVNEVSLSDVNEALKKHLSPGGLKILVYGDRKFVAPQLKTWNPEIVDVK